MFRHAHKLYLSGAQLTKYHFSWHFLSRAANNGRSTDNVHSELSIDRTNPWIAGHVVRSFTDSFREILIFNSF